MSKKANGPKILLLDIETAPLLGYVWGLWENNVALNQIKSDWHILSWSAKWLDDAPNKIMYKDQRNAKNIEDDKELLKGIWKLLDEADIIVTQNGKSFDEKKLNARFIMNGFQPPSDYRHIDTKRIASKKFAFTSNKLEYLTDKLNKKYKKIKHAEFGGFELWKECLAGNIKAWKEMEKYNKYDVLSLEELYKTLMPWENSIHFNTYHDGENTVCTCGASDWERNGWRHKAKGRYQRFRCKSCGKSVAGSVNALTKEKRREIKS